MGLNDGPMEINLNVLHRGRLRHFVKYALVSVVATLTSLTMLGLLVGVYGWSSVWANVLATASRNCSLVSSSIADGSGRRAVKGRGWHKWSRSAHSRLPGSWFRRSLSASRGRDASPPAGSSTRHAVEVANFGSYGALWLFQFFLCDKVLFKARGPVDTHAASQIADERFTEVESAA